MTAKSINVADLIDATAEITFICRAKLVGPSRLGMVSRARKIIYYLGPKHGHSLSAVGRRIGVDHSSVIVGRKAAIALLETDNDFAADVAQVEARAYAVAEDRKARIARMVPVELRAA